MDPFVIQLAELCRAHVTTPKWVVVPTHALAHTLGDRLALEGTSWLNLRFRTPFDIALEMAMPSLVDRGIDPTAEDSGPALMMRLLRELPDDVPGYFRHLSLHPPMGAALWSAVRELRLAGIGSSALPAAAFHRPEKHAELVALLAAYERHLTSRGQADSAIVYREALACLELSPIERDDPVVLMPDVIWNPAARALLDALPGRRVEAAVPHVPDLERPRRLADMRVSSRDTGSPLARLMAPHELPSANGSNLNPTLGLTLDQFRAGGREAEVEEIFRRIVSADPPLRLDAVEIACGSPDYVGAVREKAERYGWPVTYGPGVPAQVTRPARALLAWCDWIESGFPASGLRRMLQSGDVRLHIDDGPKPGRAARLLLRSEATWGRHTYGASLSALAASDRSRAADLDADEGLREALEQRAGEADRLRAWIQDRLDEIPSQGDVRDGAGPAAVPLQRVVEAAVHFAAEFTATPGELDARSKAAVEVAVGELRALGAVLRPLDGCLELVRAALEDVTVHPDRARPGHLHVTLLRRAGYAGRPHTFIVGMQEGRVVPAAVEDPVLLDEERQAIHPSLATSADRVQEALHAVVGRIASLQAGDGSTVTLSYSSSDLREYRETYPSWLMLQARRLQAALEPGADAAAVSAIGYDALIDHLGEPVSIVPADPSRALADAGWWLHAARRGGPSVVGPLLDAHPWLRQGRVAEQARDSDEFTIYDGLVADAGVALDPRQSDRPVSPTALEKLADCPFQYFLKYGLRLNPIEDDARSPDEWLDSRTRGSELHALYARAMRRFRADRGANPAADPRDLRDWLRGEATARLDRLRHELPPPSDAVFEDERDRLLDDLDLFLGYEVDRIAEGREALAFEVGFGFGGQDGEDETEALGQGEAVAIELGDLAFRVRGRIDRIDRVGESRYEVVDYKTGLFFTKKFSGVFKGGRLLQHALYGLAAEPLLRRTDPSARVDGGAYYFPASRGLGQRHRIPRQPTAAIGAVVGSLLDLAAAGAFVSTHEEDDCRFCEFGAVCDSDAGGEDGPVRARVRAARKVARADDPVNAVLQPFVKAREHD